MFATAKAHKNLHKLRFYAQHTFHRLIPGAFLQRQRKTLLRELKRFPDNEQQKILYRVNYCNQLDSRIELPEQAISLSSFKREKSGTYYLDLLSVLRYFPPELRFCHRFGDVTTVPDVPTLVKSRPINDHNQNSVLLKLNRVRHYYTVKDPHRYDEKLDLVVWRGSCHQEHRRQFIRDFYDHPLCNVGDIHKNALGQPWHKHFMSVPEQLKYKFVLSIEGKDVATNLKWIMASNSLCFMRRPRFETWFMEGALQPGYHYVLLKDDYSDLEDKINYYRENPCEAKAIISNANRYVDQFMNAEKERLIGLLIMQKYFERTHQFFSD
ncbi:glycosyltransferase family 90 protein [Halomonas sp. Mc5H-6]|uniref:glycosyltransferase family 90 protein n=1 Tax=Halomonas sp. Mc5H-6 TaxID=2954500 RepID=UPI00209857EC|nr:glycosyltransferase family 90 protein [Halomonas sp. Mc5H-6]MCO7245802.1 glycosyltransferase family 90 protein [Halomonas sp. Mc5H-6]